MFLSITRRNIRDLCKKQGLPRLREWNVWGNKVEFSGDRLKLCVNEYQLKWVTRKEVTQPRQGEPQSS